MLIPIESQEIMCMQVASFTRLFVSLSMRLRQVLTSQLIAGKCRRLRQWQIHFVLAYTAHALTTENYLREINIAFVGKRLQILFEGEYNLGTKSIQGNSVCYVL